MRLFYMLLYNLFKVKFFLLGLVLGIVMLFLFPVQKKNITLYPNDNNDIQYVDKANNCFEFDIQEVKCPNNPLNVKLIPIQ